VERYESAVLPPCHPGHGPSLRPARQHSRAVQQHLHLLGARLDLRGHCGRTQPVPEKVRDRAQGMENISPALGSGHCPISLSHYPTLGHPIILHIPKLTRTELVLTASKTPWQGIVAHREPPRGCAGCCPPARWWPCSCTPRHLLPPRPGSAGSVPRPGPACGHPPNAPRTPRQQLSPHCPHHQRDKAGEGVPQPGP